MGVTKADLFNLTVTDTGSGIAEKFLNLTVQDSPRRIDKVLEAESKLVRWDGTWPPSSLPTISAGIDDVSTKEMALAEKEKDLTAKEKELADAQNETPPNPATVAAATTARNTAKTSRDTAKTALDTALNAMNSSDGIAINKTANFTPPNAERDKKGLYALEQADLFNLLCIPPYLANGDVEVSLVSDAAAYCEKRRAMLLVDPPSDWKDKCVARERFTDPNVDYVGTRSKNSVLFFPRLKQPNPLRDNQMEEFAPCGAAAGIFARTDTQRGVWKAPAGLEATLVGVPQLSVNLTDPENGELNPLGINCLRAFPIIGRIVWGARTLQGADQLASEWKYTPVRRTALVEANVVAFS